jgi:hypothetical protein
MTCVTSSTSFTSILEEAWRAIAWWIAVSDTAPFCNFFVPESKQENAVSWCVLMRNLVLCDVSQYHDAEVLTDGWVLIQTCENLSGIDVNLSNIPACWNILVLKVCSWSTKMTEGPGMFPLSLDSTPHCRVNIGMKISKMSHWSYTKQPNIVYISGLPILCKL